MKIPSVASTASQHPGVPAWGRSSVRVFCATLGRKALQEPVGRPLLHCARGHIR